MMHFNFTEEQILIKNMAREFAEEEILPIAAEIDRTHEYPAKTIRRMGELGMFGLGVPEEYGGAGGDFLTYILALEEISKVCASHGCIYSVNRGGGIGSILLFGSEAQKQKYLPDLASGAKISGFAVTEPGAGSDAAAQKTTAVRKGDTYLINGSKVFISNGSVAETFLVSTMTDPSKGLKGISTFIVEKAFPGFKVGQLEDKMGIRAAPTAEILFEDCEVPAENRVGPEGGGFKIIMQALDGARVSMSAQAVGLAQGALNAALAYSKERIQFGRPISANQGLQWMLAEMDADIEASRQLLYNAARRHDAGVRYTREAAIVKLLAAQTAMRVTTKAVQIHGGIGYTTSYPVERYMRDAKIIEIYDGTNEIQKMIIAGQLLA